jgi:hypothetical protein
VTPPSNSPQLHDVLSDITGVTGLSIIRTIVAGEHDPSAGLRQADRGSPEAAEEKRHSARQ